MHKLHDWSKKCFGKGFGWICALNKSSVQERAQTSFCPIARQVLHYLAWELCRQIVACILSRLTPFLLVCGVRKGGVGGGGHFGPEAQKMHMTVMNLFLRLLLQSSPTESCKPLCGALCRRSILWLRPGQLLSICAGRLLVACCGSLVQSSATFWQSVDDYKKNLLVLSKVSVRGQLMIGTALTSLSTSKLTLFWCRLL